MYILVVIYLGWGREHATLRIDHGSRVFHGHSGRYIDYAIEGGMHQLNIRVRVELRHTEAFS